MFRALDDRVSVWGQITPADIAAAKAAGFVALVNNRPDGEEPGQPDGATLQRAAQAAGLDYTAIPVDHSGFRDDQVTAMAQALDAAGGPLLAFCRSGTRSTFLWALARARLGDEGAALIAKAAQAGYDLSPIRRDL